MKTVDFQEEYKKCLTGKVAQKELESLMGDLLSQIKILENEGRGVDPRLRVFSKVYSGIPDAEKEAVFRRFYRLGNEETRSTKGTDLGLYIVHYLTHAHGWQLRILDNAGGGSIFELSFPIIS